MKTDFSILWVDDKPQLVSAIQGSLEQWLDDQGLQLIVYPHKSETGMLDDLAKKEIELIVLDYNLPKRKGDLLINDIRDNKYYQDIIFYSQGGVPSPVFARPPDGVYFVDKQDAVSRIKDLLTLIIRRTSDLATLRGWIVADTIELEARVLKILTKYFEQHKELFQARTLKVLSEDGAFFFGRLKGMLAEVLKEHVERLAFSENGVFDFGSRYKILSGAVKDHISFLKNSGAEQNVVLKLIECKKVLDAFPDEIIETRNTLAHQMAEMSATGQKTLKTRAKQKKEIVVSPQWCADTRKSLRKHLENLHKLEALVCITS